MGRKLHHELAEDRLHGPLYAPGEAWMIKSRRHRQRVDPPRRRRKSSLRQRRGGRR
jgi:hypothetical protein